MLAQVEKGQARQHQDMALTLLRRALEQCVLITPVDEGNVGDPDPRLLAPVTEPKAPLLREYCIQAGVELFWELGLGHWVC